MNAQLPDFEVNLRGHPTHLALYEYICELSELTWAAGWMGGIEWMLWQEAMYTNGPYFAKDLTPDQAEKLRRLSREAGGWIEWPHENDPRKTANDMPQFVPLDEWKRIYAEASRKTQERVRAQNGKGK